MLKLENTEVFGLEHAIRGMRNPMNSWEKGDSFYCPVPNERCSVCEYRHTDACYNGYVIGPNDHKLMVSLANDGPVHAKYRRMIVVNVDITAPLYWCKEFDTYKVGTVSISCSTMHKIHDKEFTLEYFSIEHLNIRQSVDVIRDTIGALNVFRNIYLNGGPLHKEDGKIEFFTEKDKNIWWQMIQLLPNSYNQKRTVMLNYEVLANIYQYRYDHKLDEWHIFCDWIESLPYSKLITCIKESKDDIENKEGTVTADIENLKLNLIMSVLRLRI